MRFWLLLLIGLTACTAAPPGPAEPSVLVYQPRLAHGAPSPFPCDAAMTAEGIAPHDDLVSRGARRPGGFAPWSPIWLRFRGPAIDVAGLPHAFRADAAAPILVHVAPAGATAPTAASLADAGALAAYRVVYDEATNTLVLLLRSGVGERSRVTVVVRNTLKNVLGGDVALDTGFDAYFAARPGLPRPADALAVFTYDTAPVQTLYAAMATATEPLRRVHAGEFEVFAPATLPTGAPVTALAERLPPFGWDIEPGSLETPLTGVGAVVFGRLELGAVRGDDGALALTPDLVAAATPERVPFMLVLPDPAAVRPAARARLEAKPRYPVVVFGHGYTACKETMLGFAAVFAQHGLALLAIDAVGHGERGERGDDAGQCGLRLPSDLGTDPGSVENGMAETVQQNRQLVRLIPELAERIDVSPADGVPDLLTESAGYVGQSMGSVFGPAVVSQEPALKAAVFNVGISGLAVSLLSRGSTAEKSPGAAFFAFDSLGLVSSLTLAGQLYEPMHFISGLAGKAVLMQQAEYDELLPALGTEWMALALDATQEQGAPRPVAALPARAFPAAGTAAYHSVFAEADHIFFIKASGASAAATRASQEQAAGFLATALAGGEPVVSSAR